MSKIEQAVKAFRATIDQEQGLYAYLALTGKLELAVRDQLAWWLHTHYQKTHVIGRDITLKDLGRGIDELDSEPDEKSQGPRIDLVALPRLSKLPAELAESKQFYTFDYRKGDRYLKRQMHEQIVADANRLINLPQHPRKSAPRLILLICHLHRPHDADKDYPPISKYDIASRKNVPDSTNEILKGLNLDEKLVKWEFNLIDCIPCGSAFGYTVQLTTILGSRKPQMCDRLSRLKLS